MARTRLIRLLIALTAACSLASSGAMLAPQHAIAQECATCQPPSSDCGAACAASAELPEARVQRIIAVQQAVLDDILDDLRDRIGPFIQQA